MLPDGLVACFLSHKCNDQAHALADQLAAALEPFQVALLKDPFETGHEILTRIHTVEFHAFVFLLCPESWASAVCQDELRTAQAQSVPTLTVRLTGVVPAELKERLYKNVEGLAGGALERALAEVAAIVAIRAQLYKRIAALNPNNPPEVTRAVAQSLSDDADRTLIAESLDHIASFYRPDADETTRFWLALAVGKAGTCKAREILKRFSWESHPFPKEGIRQAQERLSGVCG